jgi:hypothetical protein
MAVYYPNQSIAQGGFHSNSASLVQVDADKKILSILAQMEEIGLQGQVAGACGEGRIYSEAQNSSLKAKQNELYALGPKAIPDILKCIESHGLFSKAGFEWCKSGPHSNYQYKWVIDYPRNACGTVLARHGAISIDYICKGGLPTQNTRSMLYEEVAGAIGPAAAIRITELLTSKNENERFWATGMLNSIYSYINGTADRENGQYARLMSQMPMKEIAAKLSNSPVPKDDFARKGFLVLLGHSSYGEEKELAILEQHLKSDTQRNNRSTSAGALIEIASRADARVGALCIKVVGEAMKSDQDDQVRDSIAYNLGGGSFRIRDNLFANERIAILKAGTTDSNKGVRSRCEWGLRSLKQN